MDNVLTLIGREHPLFANDILAHDAELRRMVQGARFLVIGGAGSIGQAVVQEIFQREPKLLHVVDLSENNLVELVRDLRSSKGYIPGEFRTFAIDSGSIEFSALMSSGVQYDYVLNLSALKHVRSERDPYTLMRLIEVNVLNTIQSFEQAIALGARKYFCVSTDKAANPVSMMGASKRIMEMYVMQMSRSVSASSARFANVAFSDGSLLHGFNQRFMKRQPIAAPTDVRRYFLAPAESGQLCLMSCLLGGNKEIFFPKLSEEANLSTFSEIAKRYLLNLGFEPHLCETEEEARVSARELIGKKRWPCYFFRSDTTGEKDVEEFFVAGEELDVERFEGIGIVRNSIRVNDSALNRFRAEILSLRSRGSWDKAALVELVKEVVPEFSHLETGKYLDDRM